MFYFFMGFLSSGILLILYIFLIKNEQKKIAFQLNLILKKNSSSPIKAGSIIIESSLLEAINIIICELLMQKKDFELSKKNLKSMVTSISHDFRTPLTSISGYIQMLLDNDDISTKEKIKYLTIIKNRSISLSAIVEDFYSMTSIDSLDYPFVINKVSISNVLREIIASYYNELENTFSKINVNIDSNCYIYSDKNALDRVFSNLIKNSFIYGADNIDISLIDNNANNTYDIKISNSLPKNFKIKSKEDIFKRNYSVDWANGSKSTGLGLAIAKSLTEKSGGTINANIDKNTISFKLSFPKIQNN